jgi:thiamine pyrophosphate-dependent acetolactate synthase large subunit-like protein
MDIRDPAIDYAGLARSMGVPARRVSDPSDVVPALREAAARGGPGLIEVMVADGFGA